VLAFPNFYIHHSTTGFEHAQILLKSYVFTVNIVSALICCCRKVERYSSNAFIIFFAWNYQFYAIYRRHKMLAVMDWKYRGNNRTNVPELLLCAYILWLVCLPSACYMSCSRPDSGFWVRLNRFRKQQPIGRCCLCVLQCTAKRIPSTKYRVWWLALLGFLSFHFFYFSLRFICFLLCLFIIFVFACTRTYPFKPRHASRRLENVRLILFS
jgi:hypothetical protein